MGHLYSKKKEKKETLRATNGSSLSALMEQTLVDVQRWLRAAAGEYKRFLSNTLVFQ